MRNSVGKFVASLLLFLALAINQSVCISAAAQVNSHSFVASGVCRYVSKNQTWELTDIELTSDATILTIDVNVTSREAGGFGFPPTIYISGTFGKYYLAAMTIGDEEWTVGRWYYYAKRQKGKTARCKLYFPRIPAGVKYINYCEPDFITWNKIAIKGNEDMTVKTIWTETSLKNNWEGNGISPVEGMYDFISSSNENYWGHNAYRFAVVKSKDGFDCVYIKGANPLIWKEGELKCHFTMTADANIYKADGWMMDNKLVHDNMFLQFTDKGMRIYDNGADVEALFLKVYPSAQHVSSAGKPSIQTGGDAVVWSGSGFFVSTNVIATNYHVVKGAKRLEAQIKRGGDVETVNVEVLCCDKQNDLALIIVRDQKFKNMESLPYGLVREGKDAGTYVFTMGYPMSDVMGDEVKVTDGIISSKTGYDGDIVRYQISAAIQPGNSGGALFDKDGNVVGVTDSGITQAQNVGYAIKTTYLTNLIESAPVTINVPDGNELAGSSLTEQIKTLAKYIVLIKAY